MHALPVVAQRFGSGLTRVFLSTDPIYRWSRGQLVRILFVLGIGTLLLRRGRRDILPFPILAVGGTAFVVPLHGFDWRLVYHVAPFIYLLAAIGLVGATDGLRLSGSWLYRRAQPAPGSR